MPIYNAWVVFEVVSDDGYVSKDAQRQTVKLTGNADTPGMIVSAVSAFNPLVDLSDVEAQDLIDELEDLALKVEKSAAKRP